VAFDHVLMVGEGDQITVGAPLVEGASVNATLIETRKGEKVKIFKKIRRQGYRRTRGHRQIETVLRVTGIDGAGQSEAWAGEVDLTPRSVLRLRSRNLARTLEEATAHAEAKAARAHAEPEADVKPAKKTAAKKSAAKKPAAKKPAAKKPAAKKA
jgi:large subunit ribosomal protein L21